MSASRRRKVDPTHDWQLLPPLFGWPEQERYEDAKFAELTLAPEKAYSLDGFEAMVLTQVSAFSGFPSVLSRLLPDACRNVALL
jgi:hypothetical protein